MELPHIFFLELEKGKSERSERRACGLIEVLRLLGPWHAHFACPCLAALAPYPEGFGKHGYTLSRAGAACLCQIYWAPGRCTGLGAPVLRPWFRPCGQRCSRSPGSFKLVLDAKISPLNHQHIQIARTANISIMITQFSSALKAKMKSFSGVEHFGPISF